MVRHSREICSAMAPILPEQLYAMICATNRSLPEMNACILSTNILITFSKHPSTKRFSFVPDHIDSLLSVMLHWCDKESKLFPSLCTLIWIHAQVKEWREVIVAVPNFNQIVTKMRTLVSRKASMVRRAGVKGTSLFSITEGLPMPSLKPDFGLTYNKRGPNTFTNSVLAMEELCKVLKI